MAHGALWWGKVDPGPCPVDDTPHTACTPESVAALEVKRRSGRLTVPVRPPRVFSTASYPRLLNEPPKGPRLADERAVRMTADEGSLRTGQTYWVRRAHAERLVARGVAEAVVLPSAPAGTRAATPARRLVGREQERPSPPVREPQPPPPPRRDPDDDDDDEKPPPRKGRK